MRDLILGLQEPIPLLDHGFVRMVDAMPRLAEADETADHAIVRAARADGAMSDGEGEGEGEAQS